jgi:hypothetical protein
LTGRFTDDAAFLLDIKRIDGISADIATMRDKVYRRSPLSPRRWPDSLSSPVLSH